MARNVQQKAKKKRAYGTPDSHVVPHRSTDRACSGLTAQFGRDTVLFTEYGRRRVQEEMTEYMIHSSSPIGSKDM
jgi:myosin-crossreactive antigen